MPFAIPCESVETRRPGFDCLRQVHAQSLQGIFAITVNGCWNAKKRGMNVRACDVYRLKLRTSDRSAWSDRNVRVARSDALSQEFVSEAIRSDPKKPQWTRAKETLRSQEVLKNRVLGFKLQQDITDSRPTGQPDVLNAVETASSSERAASTPSHRAARRSENVPCLGVPVEEVGEVRNFEDDIPLMSVNLRTKKEPRFDSERGNLCAGLFNKGPPSVREVIRLLPTGGSPESSNPCTLLRDTASSAKPLPRSTFGVEVIADACQGETLNQPVCSELPLQEERRCNLSDKRRIFD